MLEVIWGLKTQAIFDVWTFEHILTGVSVGAAVVKTNDKIIRKLLEVEHKVIKTLHFDIFGVLAVAFAWETVEHYLEQGLAGETVEYWFQGTEFWANRIISDPLMLVLGYFIAKKHGRFVIPARIFSIIWLIMHVFVFPHSMYLHDLF